MTKRSLPSLGSAASVSHAPPSVDEAREALGGRIEAGLRSPHEAGALIHFRDVRGNDVEGVLVFAAADALDVWVGEGRFHRVPQTRVKSVGPNAPTDHPLADVAADALVFAQLHEGARIRFVDRKNAMQAGTLVEKCRYGALVENEAKTILAVSFRRLWPV